jgi:hypothetical protein
MNLTYAVGMDPAKAGGLGRIRTADKLIKSQLLYQLSYKPKYYNEQKNRHPDENRDPP